jgi:tetratricopeptide (TPR) repeat protein
MADDVSITSHTSLQEVSLPSDRAMLYMERAKHLSLISTGTSIELERQLRELYKSLSYKTDDPKVYMLMAKVYKQNLDISSAMFCYRFVLKLDPGNLTAIKFLVDLLALKGKELMIAGKEMNLKSRFIAARCCFDEALEFNRENYELWVLKAICHIHSEELTEAYEAMSKVLRPNRELPAEFYILRAKINWGRGLVEQGNQDIRIAASLDPDHPEVIGYINRSYAKSEMLYKKCLDVFKDGNYKLSLEHIDHAIFLTNEDVKLHLMRSKILRMMKDYQTAYEAVLKAKALFEAKYEEGDYPVQVPADINLQINLILNEMAINYAEQGNYDKAILLLNKIIRNDTKKQINNPHMDNVKVNFKYLVNRGDCYRALQKLDEAILDYEAALAVQPNEWDIKTKLSLSLYLVATTLFNNARYADVDVQLSKAIECNPKVSEYFVLRGKARYYMARYFDAHADFKKALQLDPSNTEVKQRLQQFEDDNTAELMKSKPTIHGAGRGNKGRSRAKTENNTKNAMELSMAQYKTEKKVVEIKVQDDDVIDMMLNPRKAQELPALKMITNDKNFEEREKEIRNHRQVIKAYSKMIKTRIPEKELPLVETLPSVNTLPAQLLPEITSCIRSSLTRENENKDSAFYNAYVATRKAKVKGIIAAHVLNESPDISRGHMWKIVDTAKELALPKAFKKK